jgi:hypothetical protein
MKGIITLFPAFPSSNFTRVSVIPQITYGNMALIFLSHFHGYNKNEIFADYWDHDLLELGSPSVYSGLGVDRKILLFS